MVIELVTRGCSVINTCVMRLPMCHSSSLTPVYGLVDTAGWSAFEKLLIYNMLPQ